MRLGTGSLFVALVMLWVALPVQTISSPPHPGPAISAAFSDSMPLNNTTLGSHSAVPFWNNSSVWEGYTFGFPSASSPWGTFGLTYAFGGQIQLTGGAVDAGTNRSGRVMVGPPSYSELNITVASQSVSVPLPSPLGLNQSFPFAGLDLELNVPYLGSLTLAAFSLAIVVSVEIEGDSTVSGCGTGAGHPVWDGSEGFDMTACARNLTLGSSFVSTLSNISFVLAIEVQAEAEITPLYTKVITIIPMTPLVPLPAPVSSVQSTFKVVNPLSHLHAYVTPNPTVYGNPVYVFSNVSGGAGNVIYSYGGTLPGSGCSSMGQGVLTCTATSTGNNFSMEVIATDQEGSKVSKWVSYSASPPPQVPGDGWSPPPWDTVMNDLTTIGEIFGGILVATLLLAGVGGYLRSRRDGWAGQGPHEGGSSTSHSTTALDYENTESAESADVHSIPLKHSAKSRPTAVKSTSARPLPHRDPLTGRFVKASAGEKSRSRQTSTKKKRGHKD